MASKGPAAVVHAMADTHNLHALTDRDLDTLEELAAANRDRLKHDIEEGWAKPMDIGASDASHHSATLKKLVRRGLVDIRDASTKRPGASRYYRAGCWYRINLNGLDAIKTRRAR